VNVRAELLEAFWKLSREVKKCTGVEIKVDSRMMKRCLCKRSVRRVYIQIDKFLEMKEKWSGWIFANIDKNAGCIAVACPLWYKSKMLSTFN
jgi:hypothetical protein